jgi:hypothetical protein
MAGVLGIANGGTGTTTSGGALNALLPPQTGQGGKFLQTNGATVSWTAEAGSGTVTSVNVSGGSTGLTFSGGPITAAGNLTMAGTLAVANGGTGATTTIAAINALLPSQSGQGGNQLGTDGTNVSWVSSGIELPSGTVLAFFQAAAPTGWTQVTTAALNNSAIRIVTTAGGGTGGTIGFNTLFSPTSTYTGTLNVTSGQVGDTSLSEAQLASHTHSYIESDNGSRRITGTAPACNNGVFPAITGATGGGSTHTHSLIGAVAGGNFTTDFDLQYIDMILASKN